MQSKLHFLTKGFLLVNYPLTEEEHFLLEESMTGFYFPH